MTLYLVDRERVGTLTGGEFVPSSPQSLESRGRGGGGGFAKLTVTIAANPISSPSLSGQPLAYIRFESSIKILVVLSDN